ncbi:MAG: hypothetical protein KA243_02280 [Candidatus Aminicenantes bacterium]|nr:hypothetical protein [Candidatus Aminicenantes bacterium]
MLGPKTKSYLAAQAKRLVALDEAEGGHPNVMPYRDERTGQAMTGMAKLYENALWWMNSPEAARVLGPELGMVESAINEDTLSTGIASFVTTALPAIRRIYSRLWSKEVMSLQTLGSSAGYIFWFKTLFDSTYGDATANQELADVPEEYRYSKSSEQGTIRKVSLQLTKKLIETENYKLAGLYTLEAEQDLRAAQGLDASSEIGVALADQIAREIDRNAVNSLWDAAKTNVNFNLGGYLPGDTSTADRQAYDAKLWKSAVVQANNAILKATNRNAGWMLMGPDVFAYFMALEAFRLDGAAASQQTNGGISFMGTFSGLWKIYLDPAAPANKILMGLTPTSWQDAVGVIATYIPLFLSDDYTFGADFSQKMRGAMSRVFVGAVPETSTQSPVKNGGLTTITLSAS